MRRNAAVFSSTSILRCISLICDRGGVVGGTATVFELENGTLVVELELENGTFVVEPEFCKFWFRFWLDLGLLDIPPTVVASAITELWKGGLGPLDALKELSNMLHWTSRC